MCGNKTLFKSLKKLLRQVFARKGSQDGRYRCVTLTDEEIEQGKYKVFFGGGSPCWDSRGAFQLYFLQIMGMSQPSKVLDIGCGPGRGAKHLLGFLNKGNYCGIDNNFDFIKAALAMVKMEKLAQKRPEFFVVENFDVKQIKRQFDYAIAFSVLNHCNPRERRVFFKKVHNALSEDGKLYISHAQWFCSSYLIKSKMVFTNQFGPNDFDIAKFGWGENEGVFPIIELRKKV